MNKTLMVGLNEKDMQAVINTYDLKPYYYPTLLPLTETPFLAWKMLKARAGLKIAADLVSRDSTVPKKIREAILRVQGGIPKIMISRERQEDELTGYDIMVAMSSTNPDLRALVEFQAEGIKFCWDGVAARAEWIALKEISLGKVKFTNSNNAVAVIEYDVDYMMSKDQKIGVEAPYTSGVSGKPLTEDFPKAMKLGKKLFGATCKSVLMNVGTFEKFASQEEVVRKYATFTQNVTNTCDAPDLTTVNAYLAKEKGTFKGLQIIVIDQEITIKLANEDRETSNPFEDSVISFSESKVLGKTYWKKPTDISLKSSVVEKAMNGHTLIKKYSGESPVKEVTEGIANLFPAWDLAGRSLLMQVSATSWTK